MSAKRITIIAVFEAYQIYKVCFSSLLVNINSVSLDPLYYHFKETGIDPELSFIQLYQIYQNSPK